MNAKEFMRLTIRDFENGAVIDEVYLALKERDKLREALEESVLQPKIIQQMMQEHGIVIDNHDEKMQKFALTLYTVLVNLSSIAQAALKQTEPEKEYDDLTSTIDEQQEFERGCLERLDLLLKKQTEGGGDEKT